MAEAQNMVVLGFDTPMTAQEMLDAALRLQAEGKLRVRDAVFVTKDDKGHVHVKETTDPSTRARALGGAFWGLVFGAILLVPVAGMAVGAGIGALTGKMIDSGMSDKFVKQLRESIQPGKTYLAMLVSHGDIEAALTELRRFKGMAEFVDSSMPEQAVAQVKEALATGPTTR